MLDQLFTGHAAWFSVPALVGTAVFLLRVVFMLIGGGDLDDGAADLGDIDVDFGDADTGDASDFDESGHAFTWLSVQSIAAFGMGFGWGGLGALNGAGWNITLSIAVALVAGLGMIWLLALLLKALHDMQSSGNLSIRSAIGATGDVYLTVPAHDSGTGQVRLVIGDRERFYNATTSGESLPTKTRVNVVAVNGDNTLNVISA
jgi:membrane protein implicated in regulation of membrane protease activity